MSENVTNFSIRAHIPELDSYSAKEALNFFRKRLGEPDDVDEYKGEVDYFNYDYAKHDLVPVYSSDENKWGIEHIFVKTFPYDIDTIQISISDLEKWDQKIRDKFPHVNIGPLLVCSYTYYNGTDEPISFDPSENISV